MHGDNEEFLEADDMAKASGKGRHVKAGRSVAEDGSCDHIELIRIIAISTAKSTVAAVILEIMRCVKGRFVAATSSS